MRSTVNMTCWAFLVHPLMPSCVPVSHQAPSASLCVSILSLHSDPEACGHQLIGHCRSLSRTLTNPEVDARLITDVMRQLLFSAKVMFVKTGQTQNLELCDRLADLHIRTRTE